MKGQRSPFSTAHKIGSLLLMLALLWLSVSTPFVYRFQQQQKAAKAALTHEKGSDADEDSGNPLSNTNEEKTESGVSMPQEYLHEPIHLHHPLALLDLQYHSYAQDDFVAFHPEFITPPPDAGQF
ncbi:MAG: hypothetical protein EOO08_00960 [Chitinophagaceae bacterium]|nr:MAG: hypothetical protein EOO08_00960 [Chitinophagaceae bacterium]